MRCLQDELPDPGTTPTCDTGGIITPAVHVAASLQVAEILKYIIGDQQAIRTTCITIDLWTNQVQTLDSIAWRDPDCAACGEHPTWPFLSAKPVPTVHLCGRDGFQCQRPAIDLPALAQRLGDRIERHNSYFIRWQDDQRLLTAFADGRVLVQHVDTALAAEAAVDRWLA